MRYGFNYEPSHFEGWTDEEKEEFCEQCWDGSYFPAYRCKECVLFKAPENYVFCSDCKFDDYHGHCYLDMGRSWHAAGWGCTKGEVDDRPTTEKFYELIRELCLRESFPFLKLTEDLIQKHKKTY